ncbi:hypothetical protein MOW08_05470 [Acinetobacter schindleri]|nr:hypothetical protein MOW08_05470 [Acinetobacter schindleri]
MQRLKNQQGKDVARKSIVHFKITAQPPAHMLFLLVLTGIFTFKMYLFTKQGRFLNLIPLVCSKLRQEQIHAKKNSCARHS